jgi:hypothetical protein
MLDVLTAGDSQVRSKGEAVWTGKVFIQILLKINNLSQI